MLLCEPEFLRKEEESFLGETYKQSKVRKREIAAMVVLSALTEEHGRPHPKPTFEVASNP